MMMQTTSAQCSRHMSSPPSPAAARSTVLLRHKRPASSPSSSRPAAAAASRSSRSVAARCSGAAAAAADGNATSPNSNTQQPFGRKPAPSSSVRQFEYLVLGSGIAGLSYALKVAEYGRVAVVTKDYANEGCTQYAQGGVCAVLDACDSVDSHVEDTMVAGAFLNDRKAVDAVCREGPARVLELVKLGADFTRNSDGTLHLTREGGHTNRRIVHAADLTGREIERALLASARAHPNISFFEHHLATELVVDEAGGALHCFGVDVLDQHSACMTRFLGLATMLATGGAGQVYPSTTNPHVATGDGMAMAYRAGAAISNMEFVQFHPTALYSPPKPAATASGNGNGHSSSSSTRRASAGATERTFLITEAVRGEGGMLFNLKGERFMPQYDSRLELAPRDVVARAIQDQMLGAGDPHVLLDISHKPAHDVLEHFPNIAARCAEDGIDITRDPIPVLPAQHYMCGGVSAGLRGETSIQGLFACGEVACSGLHGANRLASNSLLEGLVFADRAAGPSVAHAEYAARTCGRQLNYAAASADFTGSKAARPLDAPTEQWVAAKRAEIKALMWSAAGIVRRSAALQAAQAQLAATYLEVKAAYRQHGVSTPMVELLNLATVAELIVSCALQRRESRGLHFSPDFPDLAPKAVPSLIESALKARVDLDAVRGALLATAGSSGSGSGSTTSSIVSLGSSGSSSTTAASSPAPTSRPQKSVVVRDMSLRAEAADK